MPDQAVFEELRAEFNEALPSLARGEPDRTDLMTGQGLNIDWGLPVNRPTASVVRAAILEVYGISPAEYYSQSREPVALEARRMAAYVLCTVCKLSSAKAGQALRRDHTTVLHSCNKIAHMRQRSREVEAHFKRVLKIMNVPE